MATSHGPSRRLTQICNPEPAFDEARACLSRRDLARAGFEVEMGIWLGSAAVSKPERSPPAPLDIEPNGPVYAEMRDDTELVGLYRGNAEQLGWEFRPLPGHLARGYVGSTDMGNVSQALPAIHPMLGLGCLPVVKVEPALPGLIGC